MYEYSHVFLEHEDWPEWFTLDFQPGLGRNDPPRLLLGIARELLLRLPTHLRNFLPADHKEAFEKRGLDAEFLFDVDKPWGVGGVLVPHRRTSRDDGQKIVEYSITIPRIEVIAGDCENCGGSGKDTYFNCMRCDGTGKEIVMEWGAVNRIAATLSILGLMLDKPDKELLVGVHTKKKQLLSVTTFFGEGQANITAVLSRSFGDYLRKLSEQDLPEVKAAIKSAYLHMFPRYKRFGDFHFRANVRRNGQLIIDVPGDACGLYVDGFSRSLQETSGPMELDCHNVDGFHQQLALLSGLAALAGMARKSLRLNA